MSVIVQDDLLTAGAWAACGPTSSRSAEGLAERKKESNTTNGRKKSKELN